MIDLKVRTKWKDKPFTRLVQSTMNDNALEAGGFLRDGIYDALSQVHGSYIPPFHSKPGDFPYWITGELRDSWKTRADRLAHLVQVYSNSKYARPLEFGAPAINLLPRPYVRPTFANKLRTIAALMCQKV